MLRGRRRGLLSWLSLSVVAVVCGLLGFLQYRWIGEISLAERDRLLSNLRSSLDRMHRDFNAEVALEYRSIVPSGPEAPSGDVTAILAGNIVRWRASSRQASMFRRIGLADAASGEPELYLFNEAGGRFAPALWPDAWAGLRERMTARGPRDASAGRFPPGPSREDDGLVFAVPLFTEIRGPGRGPFEFPQPRRIILEFDREYLRRGLLPELVQRHLGPGGEVPYEVAILSRGESGVVIYESAPGQAQRIASQADLTAGMFEPLALQTAPFRAPAGPGDGARGPFGGPFPVNEARGPRSGEPGAGRGGPGGAGAGPGRWQVFVHHKAGSLEAVVEQARRRNLAVAAGVLLMLLASVGALIRYSRRAQRLAELQMEFVAGVGHELRTPLTVINTAAYNLRGRLAQDPGQVEKYGALIRREAGRLAELVEQVLRFAGAEAGRPIQEREPVSLDAILDDALDSARAVIEEAHCAVERDIEPALPAVLADPPALKRAFENLLTNAARHGAGEARWIGLRAAKVPGKGAGWVEVRIADRGPGIPRRDQKRIFEPFVRGERALRDQVHGSGLGLNLVKRIVEAHAGSVAVSSVQGERTEFIVRLPAITVEQQV